MPRILIVEDERILAKNLQEELRSCGHEVRVAHTGKEAVEQTPLFLPDVIILDVRLPDADGIKLLPTLKSELPSASVVVVTAYGSERIAVEAMKAGAREYLTKPIDMDELGLVIERLVEQQQVSDNLMFLRSREEQSSGLDRMIGDSDAIRHVKETIRRITRAEVLALPDPPTVLITGETGTGKDLVARAIHYHGPRRNKPFIHVNCGAVPSSLFESELFGHLRGAFTSASQAKKGLFEVAQGGTIFLDEIGNIEAELQSKLLHAIEHHEIRPIGGTQTRPVNIHIITATNRDLAAAVEASEFRRDLYHRLRVLTVHLPPLRDRGADIVGLAVHFVEIHCRRFGLPAKTLSVEALDVLLKHEWRGNVRELSHLIESSVLQAEGDVIEAGDLPLTVEPHKTDLSLSFGNGRTIVMDFDGDHPTLEEVERTILTAALEHARHNVSRAARLLGLTRDAMRYRLSLKPSETAAHED